MSHDQYKYLCCFCYVFYRKYPWADIPNSAQTVVGPYSLGLIYQLYLNLSHDGRREQFSLLSIKWVILFTFPKLLFVTSKFN